MADVCLRNMSCTCRLCAGEDIATLMSISKSISSNITYDDGDNETGDADAPMPPPSTFGRMTNSPPIPAARKSALPARNPPPTAAAAASDDAPASKSALPPQRKSALPTQRKSGLPARRPLLAKRAPVAQPASDDGDIVMHDSASAAPADDFIVVAPPPPRAPVRAEPPVAMVVDSVAPDPPVAAAPPVVRPAAVSKPPPPPSGSDVCMRNMSCRCSLCAGEDTAMLVSISKSISSNITYDDDAADGESAPLAPPPPLGRMTNSPPVPSVRKTVAPARPPPAVAPPPPAAIAAPAAAPAAAAVASDSSAGADMSVDEIVSKLADKNWKLRKDAFEGVKAHCERPGARHDDVEPFVEFFSKMCDDANASALEAGVQAVLAYAQHVEPFQKAIVPGVMKKLTDKGFSSRPGVVKICEDVITAFIEAGAVEDTVAALIEGTKNKKPKVPPACCANLLDALKAFGPRVVPLPALKAALPTLCESTVNGVRPIALNIVVEIHRWTGPALVQDIVGNLRQAQKTEYETLTKDMALGQAAPTKFVRGAKRPAAPGQRAGGATGAGGAGGAAAAGGGGAFDPREFAETVDLLAKLPRTEFKAKLALPKWSEKVEALKIVLDTIGPVPKLANGEYYELVNTLKILSNDANVNIVAKSVEVLGALADGLRKQFTQYARMLFPDILRKLSDKKSVVLLASNNTLDLFLQHAMTIDMMMDELKLALDASKNKAPQARVQTLAFLSRCVEKPMVSLSDKSLMLELGGLFTAAMDDTDPTVKKAGLDAFIGLLKASEQIAEWLQSMVDDVARKNPRSFKMIQQSVGTTARSGGAAAATKTAAPAAAAAVKKPAEVIESDAPPTAPAARPGLKKAPAKGPPSRFAAAKATGDAPSKPAGAATAAARRPGGAGTGGGASSSAGGDFTPMAISVAPEEAEDALSDLSIENWSEIQDGFASTKWMERKTAIEQLEAFARENSSAMTMRVIEALTVYVSKQVKDFKDSNINVVKSAFQAIGTFAETAVSKFPRGVVCLVVPAAADKISDRKVSETIRTMVLQFCEAVGPSYVLGCLLNHMPNVKTPLAHCEALVVLADCVKDFGIAVCSPRLLIDFVKGPQGLESSNPKVRTGAIAVLAVMYSQLGPALLPILNLESWKPALASLVEAEFKKTGFDPSSAMASVKRQVKDDGDGSSGGGGKKAVDPGALFGRMDISSQLTKELFADMKCEEDMAAWKKRAAAMDTVQSICDGSGGAIEFTKAVQEVLKALKARLSDSNANLKVKAAQVIGTVASCVGPDIAKMSKFLGPTLVSGVADNKKTMQTAAVDALHKWVRHNNETSQACLESLLSAVSEGLLNPVGRAELLGWAAEHLKPWSTKVDLNCLVVPTVQCLMDKSSEARERAQVVLAEVIRSVGQDTVLTAGCRDIKPAQMRTLRPLIQKVCDSVQESAGSSATAPAPVAPAAAPAAAPAVPGTPTRTGPGASRLARTGSMPSKPGVAARSQLLRPGSYRAPSTTSSADVAMSECSEDSETSSLSSQSTTLLLKMNGTKSARLAKGQHNKWVFESTSTSEMAARKSEIEAEWRPYLAPELHAKLFAPTLEKGMMAAVTDLMTCASSQPTEVVAALDWILKWCSLRIVDNNVQALAKLLDFLVKLFEVLKGLAYQLDDVEAAIFLPYLLQESGQSKPRFRVRFRDIMKLVVDVYSREKYVGYLMECFTACKNMRSRCECIDLVEHIVSTHGFHVLGKKCVKEVGKYVTAHEKELRESAINALVAVYTRTDGNLDKFFRFTGVTSQQGIDLLNARIKHLPPGSLHESASGAAVPQSPAVRQAPTRTALTPPRMPVMPPSHMPSPGVKSFSNGVSAPVMPVPVMPPPAPVMSYAPRMPQDDDDDADMMALSIHDDSEQAYALDDEQEQEDDDDPSESTIEALLLRPIDRLLTETKEIVDERSPEYADGIDALKGLYAIIDRPSGESELAFLRYYVNDIFIKLCDLLHASFGSVESTPPQPLVIQVLSLSLPTLNLLLSSSDATESIQRYAVERIILELCSKMLDPRMEEFASRGSTASLQVASMASEKKRFLLLFKALVKALRSVTEHVKAGEVYPSVINLLQRIVRNDVGEYNARDAYNHLMKTDSLDQLVGRLLLQLSTTQARALNPFEGIDVFGVLMQMHSFFSTLPQTDLFAVQIANDNMQSALRIIAESLLKTRPSSLEASLADLPMPSPVRDLLSSMGLSPTQAADLSVAISTTTTTTAGASGSARFGSNTAPTDVDNVTRRLFEPAPGPSAASATRDLARARGHATTAAASGRASFTSFNEFAASRTASVTSVRASFTAGDSHSSTSASTSSTTQLLRERLERVRKF